VQDLRRSAEQDENYPAIVFVHQGTIEESAAFFGALWPGARAVADPEARLYALFGIERGTLGQMVSPGVVACGIRATAKGNFIGRTVGDPWLMPGLFVIQGGIEGGRIVWQHHFRHAGDHPDFAAIPALLAGRAMAAD
jgi:hypothetical protein